MSQKNQIIQPTPRSPGFSPGGAGLLILPRLKWLKINLVWQLQKEKKKKKEGCSNCWATKALQAVTKWNTKRSCCLWSSYKFLIHGSLARSSPTWYGWFLAHRSWEEAALKKDHPPSSIPLCMAKPGMLEGGCFHMAFTWCFSLGNNPAAWFGDPALLSSSFYLWNSKTWVPSSTETGSGGCLWRSFVGVQASRLIW